MPLENCVSRAGWSDNFCILYRRRKLSPRWITRNLKCLSVFSTLRRSLAVNPCRRSSIPRRPIIFAKMVAISPRNLVKKKNYYLLYYFHIHKEWVQIYLIQPDS